MYAETKDERLTAQVESLGVSSIDAHARDAEWLARDLEAGRWDSYEPDQCEECGFIGVYAPEGEIECVNCGEGYILAEGPMMNHLWPLPERTQEGGSWYDGAEGWARRLHGLPLAFMLTWDAQGQQTGAGLALTDGGMNLSWEIAAGYMRLGFLPPYDVVSSLPRMGGPVPEWKEAVILALDVMAGLYTVRADQLHREAGQLEDWYREEAKKWK